MCLGIPGKVVEVFDQDGLRMGKVDFGGIRKQICLECAANAVPGQYVIVHVGFALNVIDEQEAEQIFAFLAQMNELGELEEAPSIATANSDKRQPEAPLHPAVSP